MAIARSAGTEELVLAKSRSCPSELARRGALVLYSDFIVSAYVSFRLRMYTHLVMARWSCTLTVAVVWCCGDVGGFV